MIKLYWKKNNKKNLKKKNKTGDDSSNRNRIKIEKYKLE